jgi:hypothetical protein
MGPEKWERIEKRLQFPRYTTSFHLHIRNDTRKSPNISQFPTKGQRTRYKWFARLSTARSLDLLRIDTARISRCYSLRQQLTTPTMQTTIEYKIKMQYQDYELNRVFKQFIIISYTIHQYKNWWIIIWLLRIQNDSFWFYFSLKSLCETCCDFAT